MTGTFRTWTISTAIDVASATRSLLPKGVAEPVHRLEIFTGSGRRRLWTADDKAAIVAESYAGSSVCAVARHHGLLPQQLFAWRRAGRFAVETPPVFVPAIVEPPDHAKTKGPPTHRRKGRQPRADSGIIEIDVWCGSAEEPKRRLSRQYSAL